MTDEVIRDFRAAENDDARAWALHAAENGADPARVAFFLDIAADRRHLDLVRQAAIRSAALAAPDVAGSEPVVVSTLIDLGEHEPDEDVRAEAVSALGWIVVPASVQERLGALLADAEVEELVRESAFAALTAQPPGPVRARILGGLLGDAVFGGSARRVLDESG